MITWRPLYNGSDKHALLIILTYMFCCQATHNNFGRDNLKSLKIVVGLYMCSSLRLYSNNAPHPSQPLGWWDIIFRKASSYSHIYSNFKYWQQNINIIKQNQYNKTNWNHPFYPPTRKGSGDIAISLASVRLSVCPSVCPSVDKSLCAQ